VNHFRRAIALSVLPFSVLAACGGAPIDHSDSQAPNDAHDATDALVTSEDSGAEGGVAQSCTLADFKTDGSIGARYNPATHTLAYGRAEADGHFRAYLSDADGTNERRLVYSGWPADRHQFVAEWHPSGNYLFVEVEKADHPGTSDDAIPGYGAYTDLWLVTRDGTRAWKLIDLPNDYDHALTHVAVSATGTRIAVTERVARPNLLDPNLFAGAYVFNVADFVDGPTPALANVQSYRPGDQPQGGEVDGITADGNTIAYYSTFVTHNLFSTRIYTTHLATHTTTELSTDSFSQAPRFAAGERAVVYMSGSGADIFPGEVQGADWWSVHTDGSGRQRLTFMNVRDNPQSVNHYRLAGVLSFDSDHSFYGDVLTSPLGLVGKIVRVTCTRAF
jgi:hypothetical protein